MGVRETCDALGLVIADGFGRVDAVGILHTNDASPVSSTDGFRGAAIGLRNAFDTRARAQVAQGTPGFGTIGVGEAHGSAMMVGRANRGAGALRVDEAFLAVCILQIADRVRRPAIRVRCAFAALRPVGITNGFVGRTLGIGCTFDAHSRGYITGGSVARTVRVGGARDIAPMIFGMAHLPRITVITGTTLFALADDAKRRHRTTVHVGEAFDAAEAFVTPKDAIFSTAFACPRSSGRTGVARASGRRVVASAARAGKYRSTSRHE